MRARSRDRSDHAQASCIARAVPGRIRQVHAGVMQPVSSSPACATDAAGRYACLKCISVVSIPTQTGGRPGSIASFAPQGKGDEWDDELHYLRNQGPRGDCTCNDSPSFKILESLRRLSLV